MPPGRIFDTTGGNRNGSSLLRGGRDKAMPETRKQGPETADAVLGDPNAMREFVLETAQRLG